MNSRFLYAVGLFFSLVLGEGILRSHQPHPEMTVYKTSTCKCCALWIEHVKSAGFSVTAIDVQDIAAVKTRRGVPAAVSSCHTAVVDGYAIEGHVPVDAVARLLKERRRVAGMAVPGMPIGSPGMEAGSRRDPYSIVTFDRNGQIAVFERR